MNLGDQVAETVKPAEPERQQTAAAAPAALDNATCLTCHDGGKGKLKVVKSKAQVAPKFRGPNGEAWSGRGLTPRWLSTLIAQGQTKESFAVKS